MNRIEKKFKELKKSRRVARIAFITAGYPDLSSTAKLVAQLEKNGADIIELGVPFSDPLADGPVIQEASLEALKKGVNLQKILGLVKSLRKTTQIPLCLMTYYNPVFCYGEKTFARNAAAAGADAVIIPDLPFEEGLEFSRLARQEGLLNINFLSPTSSTARIKNISASSRGFIYYVSLTGVTGGRKSLQVDLKKRITVVRKLVKIPVCVGFGISSASQVSQVSKFADGVIVGSAIVSQIKKYAGCPDMVRKVGRFTGKLFHV